MTDKKQINKYSQGAHTKLKRSEFKQVIEDHTREIELNHFKLMLKHQFEKFISLLKASKLV